MLAVKTASFIPLFITGQILLRQCLGRVWAKKRMCHHLSTGVRRIILICLGFEVIEVLSLSDRRFGTRKQLGDLGVRKQRCNLDMRE